MNINVERRYQTERSNELLPRKQAGSSHGLENCVMGREDEEEVLLVEVVD